MQILLWYFYSIHFILLLIEIFICSIIKYIFHCDYIMLNSVSISIFYSISYVDNCIGTKFVKIIIVRFLLIFCRIFPYKSDATNFIYRIKKF
jgi:hypothetical protein